MVSKDIIFFFFRLLNLTIIVGGAVYLFYRYVLKEVRTKIKERQTFFDQLRSQEREYKRKSVEIKRMITDQDSLCEELKLKVKRWNASFTTRKQEEQAAQQERQDAITQIVKIQNYSYIRKQLEHTIIPVVLNTTEESLAERYADAAVNQSYVDRVIEKMDVSSSVAQMRE